MSLKLKPLKNLENPRNKASYHFRRANSSLEIQRIRLRFLKSSPTLIFCYGIRRNRSVLSYMKCLSKAQKRPQKTAYVISCRPIYLELIQLVSKGTHLSSYKLSPSQLSLSLQILISWLTPFSLRKPSFCRTDGSCQMNAVLTPIESNSLFIYSFPPSIVGSKIVET